jgi:hypothetical protein
MQIKRIHYALASLSFLVAFITYVTTMQPSIPFWDCGEFIGAGALLGITHPPGAPLWTIIGHVGAMLPFFSDLAARYNLLSALCGALSSMLLYLALVRIIKLWRGNPLSTSDLIVHYGSALVGAMAFTWTDSVWFNSSEFIVFSPGLLFIALIIWLSLIWHENSSQPGNEKYLLLIFYLIGLSMGVHQMSMLAFFPVWVLVYFKHWPQMTVGKWILMMGTGAVAFLFIFVVILTGIPGWLGGAKVGAFPVIIALASIAAIFYLWNNNQSLAKLVLTAGGLVFLGYTTYAFVMVRGAQNPPMDQHHPSTFAALHEYIAREQYGEAHELPRRDSTQKGEPLHAATWDATKYTSDWDFFLKYQTDHMYIRYLLWNFIGRHDDNQDSGTDWTKTAGIPFIVGLFGIYWHFRRDPKRALMLMAGFLIMGLLTALYQNQQDAQPRERDYFYVGAFWIYAMWIGIGVTGIMEMLRAKFAKKQDLPMQEAGPKDREVLESPEETVPVLRGQGPVGLLGAALLLCVVLIPLNQCLGLVGMTAFGESFHQASKWGEYSRADNYVPLEYAYNILQSCDRDGILFTAGDNDTFPLWCIQDLFGVRTDVRIVNLSLGNMGWYVKQLKDDTPFGSKKVKLPSFTEAQLANPDETQLGIHTIPLPGLEGPMDAPTVSVSVKPETMQKLTGVNQPGSFSWKWTSQQAFQGKYYYTVADQLIRDIVVNNIDDRPIYFAVAVPPSYWTGLDNHVVYEGLTARVVPTEHPAPGFIDGDINEALYTQVAYRMTPTLDTAPTRGTMMTSYRNPKANRSALDDHYGTTTYFELYGRLANYYIHHGNASEAHRALDTMAARLPPSLVDYDYNLLSAIGQLYEETGDKALSLKYIQLAAKGLSTAAPEAGASTDQNAILESQFRKANLYFSAELYDSARSMFMALRPQVEGGNQLFVDWRLAQIDAKVLESKGDKKGALAKYNGMLDKYQTQLTQLGLSSEIQALAADRDRLAKELGMIDSVKGSPAPQMPLIPDRTNTTDNADTGKKGTARSKPPAK